MTQADEAISAIKFAAHEWWRIAGMNGAVQEVVIGRDGRVSVRWKDADEGGSFGLPVTFMDVVTRASTADLQARLDACVAVLGRLDAMWLEDWEPPHPDKSRQEPRLITEQCLDVWRDARTLATARNTEGNEA